MNKKLHRFIFYPNVLYIVMNFHLTIFFFQLFSRQRPENCFHWIISLRGDLYPLLSPVQVYEQRKAQITQDQ